MFPTVLPEYVMPNSYTRCVQKLSDLDIWHELTLLCVNGYLPLPYSNAPPTSGKHSLNSFCGMANRNELARCRGAGFSHGLSTVQVISFALHLVAALGPQDNTSYSLSGILEHIRDEQRHALTGALVNDFVKGAGPRPLNSFWPIRSHCHSHCNRIRGRAIQLVVALRGSASITLERLMMQGYGDRVRSFREVRDLFNDLFSNRNPISRATCKKLFKIWKTQKCNGRRTFSGCFVENPHNSLRKVAQEQESNTNVCMCLACRSHRVDQLVVQLGQEKLDVEMLVTAICRLHGVGPKPQSDGSPRH
ncbi:hypothetical protein J6590_001250 [Homalodisca vitripennis]|nr:hypothetical protein J6590_001250 [Homalodisca vitripennis]